MEELSQAGARLYAALAGLVALFHLAVLLGAPFGVVTMGGRWPGRLPLVARSLSVLSAALILWTATIWVGAAGLGPQQPPLWAEWLALAVIGLGCLANLATRSAAERRLWLPVTVVMAAAAALVRFGA